MSLLFGVLYYVKTPLKALELQEVNRRLCNFIQVIWHSKRAEAIYTQKFDKKMLKNLECYPQAHMFVKTLYPIH